MIIAGKEIEAVAVLDKHGEIILLMSNSGIIAREGLSIELVDEVIYDGGRPTEENLTRLSLTLKRVQ